MALAPIVGSPSPAAGKMTQESLPYRAVASGKRNTIS